MKIRKSTIAKICYLSLSILIGLYAKGCGSSGGGGGTTSTAIPTTAPSNVTLSADDPKYLKFDWDAVENAHHYIINEDVYGTSNYVELADATNIQSLSHSAYIPIHKKKWGTSQYTIDACDAYETVRNTSDPITLPASLSSAAIGYFKASNAEMIDNFGYSVALSADGNTMAVGAIYEDSSYSGIDPVNGEDDNSATYAGAVYVFVRSGSTWVQEAYVKASNAEATDYFGQSVTLSADGNTLAVGAYGEDSSYKGIDPANGEDDNSASYAGAVYVFTRSGSVWSQQAYVKASNTDGDDWFGSAVSLSADGNTMAVGARMEASSYTGIDPAGGQADNSAGDAGAVYVFTRTGSLWSQQAYVKASNTGTGDYFSHSVSLSADGNTMAVGAIYEDSSYSGIDPANGEDDNSATSSGAVYVFTRSGSVWSQQAYVKASNTDGGDFFGYSVSLSADGNTMAVGADQEDSSHKGIDPVGGQADNNAEQAGAVYVFTRSGSVWSQQAYVKASNTEANDNFGIAVSLSADGNTMAVSAIYEDSAYSGIDPADGEDDNTASSSGAVYVFTRTGSTWVQEAYVKASNAEASDYFGTAVSLSADGNTMAVSAYGEDSSARGIGGDQSDNSVSSSGAVYLY